MRSNDAYLNIGYTCYATNWGNDNECPKTSYPKFKIIIKKIQGLIDEVNFEVKLNLKEFVQKNIIRPNILILMLIGVSKQKKELCWLT